MKTSWTLPSTEEANAFFARYAKPVGILRKGSIFGQLVSGATAGIILYGLFYMSLITILPAYAESGAKWAALACVLVIEGASRVGLTYSIRAIIRKRWKGKDRVMTLLLIPMTVVLVSVGTLLSIYGADDGIKMVATPPSSETTTEVDSVARTRVAEIQQEWEDEKAQVFAEINPRIAATRNRNESDLKLMAQRIQDLSAKERREKKRYTTKKGQLKTKLQEIETAGVAEIARLNQDQAQEMTALRAKYKPLIDTLRSGQLATVRDINNRNKNQLEEWKTDIEGYSWFLGAVVIAFMLLLIVSITVDEVHKAGSEMEEQVEPGAFYFEDGVMASLRTAVGGRVESWVRNLILNIERGTAETKEPVRPQLIWERKRNKLNSKKSENGSTRRPASKKRKKWEDEAAALYCTPTTNDEEQEITIEFVDDLAVKSTQEARNDEPQNVMYTIKEKHRGMAISDLTQRLKDYKKRVGSQQQRAIAQKKKTGEVKKRTAQAIENNQHWVSYFETLIDLAKGTPDKKVP
jgi:hypothetical protein